MSEKENDTPNGELTIRTLAMPKDTNPHGDIFGGWVLSQMDIAGGIYTRKQTGQKTVANTFRTSKFLFKADCRNTAIKRLGNIYITIGTYRTLKEDMKEARSDNSQRQA